MYKSLTKEKLISKTEIRAAEIQQVLTKKSGEGFKKAAGMDSLS